MKQYSKKTKEGIEVTLEGKTIKKVYSKTYYTFLTFSSTKEAKKEYSKLRKGHKVL